jgi:tape measure domain-containing protein
MADAADFTLRLLDKVSGPAKGMASSIGKVARAMKLAAFGTKTGRDELGRFTAGSRGLLRNLRSLKGESGADILKNAFSHALGGLIQEAVHGVADLTKALAGTVAEFAMFGQESRLAFSQLAKHGASADKLFNHARGLAEQFGLDVVQTTDQFKELLAVQFNPQVATDLIKMGADMRVLGQSGEKVHGIITALGQIKSKGRLQSEELMQLNERSISADLVKGQLAKMMGVDRASIDGLIQRGKVGSDVAIQAILGAVKEKLHEPNIGDAGQAFADKMLAGMFGKMKAKSQNWLTDVGDQILPIMTKTFAPIQAEVSALLGNEDIKSGVVTAFEKAFEKDGTRLYVFDISAAEQSLGALKREAARAVRERAKSGFMVCGYVWRGNVALGLQATGAT